MLFRTHRIRKFKVFVIHVIIVQIFFVPLSLNTECSLNNFFFILKSLKVTYGTTVSKVVEARHHNISEKPFRYPKHMSETCFGFQKELFRISKQTCNMFVYQKYETFRISQVKFRIQHCGYRFGYRNSYDASPNRKAH